jgi:hypothetical protein
MTAALGPAHAACSGRPDSTARPGGDRRHAVVARVDPVWQDVSSDGAPDYSDLALTPEAQARLAAGLEDSGPIPADARRAAQKVPKL